jgi:SAM-dependent methyltransferase
LRFPESFVADNLAKGFAMSAKYREFYSMEAVVRHSANAKGWQYPGEEVALGIVAPLVRSKRILDLGVGGGRTVGLLALLTDQYIGVDYSPAMVSACQSRYPDEDFRVVDARDMSMFEDGSFEFVFFSASGIDAVDEQDRKKVYKEIQRILTKDGIFVFSTLNKDGRSYAESPFQLHRPGQAFDRSRKAAVLFILRNLSDPLRLPRRYRNWRAAKRRRVQGEGWAICAMAAHDFLLMNHFVTLGRLRAELDEADFSVIALCGSDSYEGALPPEVATSHSDSLYAVVQKRQCS